MNWTASNLADRTEFQVALQDERLFLDKREQDKEITLGKKIELAIERLLP